MASDQELFRAGLIPALRRAVQEMSWLLSRGYAEAAALKLVGDRHALTARQRKAVASCACADGIRAGRLERRLPLEGLRGRLAAIDGFNCLVTLETALAGGVILRGRDGCCRDLAGVHGAYRADARTETALRAVGALLERAGVATAVWCLDRPVSHSGVLRGWIAAVAAAAGWGWTVELHPDPDRVLATAEGVVATTDGWILDRCGAWFDLAGAVIRAAIPEAWVLDLGSAISAGPGGR